MALPSLTSSFSGTGSVTFPSAPNDIDGPVNIPGVTHRTQGGSLVQYKVGPTWFEATLPLAAITDAQAADLETFFDANWGSSFTYTDAAGNTFTAHFLDQNLPLHKFCRDYWECHVHLQLSAVLK